MALTFKNKEVVVSQGIASATVTRFATRHGGERTVTITKSNEKGGRLLLDFGDAADSKIIVSLDNVEDFAEALLAMKDEGIAA